VLIEGAHRFWTGIYLSDKQLTRLLQTPYGGWLYSPTPVTPALLKLDPIWDPLRADPVFQKLCEEKQP
jgi:hypothetical protein